MLSSSPWLHFFSTSTTTTTTTTVGFLRELYIQSISSSNYDLLEPNYLSFRLLAKNSQELIKQYSAQGAVFFSFSFFGILYSLFQLR